MKNTSEIILETSMKCLESWEKGTNIDSFFEMHPEAADQRRSISSILYSYFRNKAFIDYVISENTQSVHRKFKIVLSIALTEIYFHTGIPVEAAANISVNYAKKRFGVKPAGFINAVLRKTSKFNCTEIELKSPEEVSLNLPPVLLSRWKQSFTSDEIANFAKLFRSKPPFVFRLVSETHRKELLNSGCLEVSPDFAGRQFSFYTVEDPELVFKKGWLEKGLIYIQDPATLAAPAILNPSEGELILDACSAPGGKAIALSEIMNGKGLIVSSDMSFSRQKKTSANFARTGVSNHVMLVSDTTIPSFRDKTFDAVLLDVPCTNTGVGRHKPDALWRFSIGRLQNIVGEQKRILQNAASLVKPGGRLAYSTCSIEKEENSDQISAFLKKNEEFSLSMEKTILPSKTNDGAYIAVLTRKL